MRDRDQDAEKRTSLKRLRGEREKPSVGGCIPPLGRDSQERMPPWVRKCPRSSVRALHSDMWNLLLWQALPTEKPDFMY